MASKTKGKIIAFNKQVIWVKYSSGIPKIGDILEITSDKLKSFYLVTSYSDSNVTIGIAIKSDSLVSIGDSVNNLGPINFPKSSLIFGRSFNVMMEPIDGKPNIKAKKTESIMVYDNRIEKMFFPIKRIQTGIRSIDLFTPIFEGFNSGIFGSAGVGKTVLLQEVIRAVTIYNKKDKNLKKTKVVFCGIGERTREGKEFLEQTEASGNSENVATFFAQMNETPGARYLIPNLGIKAAEYIRDDLKENTVMFFDNIFRYIQASMELSALSNNPSSLKGYPPLLANEVAKIQQRLISTKDGNISSIQNIFIPADDETDPSVMAVYQHLKNKIFLSVKRASQGLYPAIDILKSSSQFLDTKYVSERHINIAHKVRTILTRYHEYKKIADVLGVDNLLEHQKTVYLQGARINNYLSQNFFVAESFTGKKGTFTSYEKLLDEFEELSSEEGFENIPPKFFLYKDSLESVKEEFKISESKKT